MPNLCLDPRDPEVPDHHHGADLPFERRLEHARSQRAVDLPAGGSQEAAPGRLPLELFARRNVEVSADGREVGRVLGDGGLRDDDRPDREQSAQPCPRRIGLLTVVQEHQSHPHHRFSRSNEGTSSPR